MATDVTKSMGLDRLRAAVTSADSCAPSVSEWTVGMHVHHCCLVMTGVSRTLIASKPPPPRERRSLLASFLLLLGYIPRGRAKASKTVVPRRDFSPAELIGFLEDSERMLTQVSQLDPQTWFKHFVFGVLDRHKASRFMRMHNQHHLKIIADIMAAGR